jgi:hypothetical protein
MQLQDYSLFLPLPGACVSEPLREWIVVDLQLRNLQKKNERNASDTRLSKIINLTLDENDYYPS